MLQLLQALFFACWRVRAVLRKIPVLANCNLPPLEFQDMPRWQFLNRAKSGERIGYVAKIEILQQCVLIDLRQFGCNRENRLDLGPEQKTSVDECVMDRFL